MRRYPTNAKSVDGIMVSDKMAYQEFDLSDDEPEEYVLRLDAAGWPTEAVALGSIATTTVETPEMTVETEAVADAGGLEADPVALAQRLLYHDRNSCRSLSLRQKASQVPSGELWRVVRRMDSQKQRS